MPIGGLLGSRPIQTLLAPGDAYHSTAAVLTAVDAIASTCAASIEVSSVGTAGEWPLKLVKLGADAPSKRRVLLTFGMHGREYQSAEIGLALITELCSGSERSQALLSRVAFAVFPLLNPVGRSRTDAEYAAGNQLGNQQCADRRKNGRLVDINRNFPVGHKDLLADWASYVGPEACSSNHEFAEDYRGEAPLSEVESQAVDRVAAEWKPLMYIDIHTGATAMYRPWNYATNAPIGGDRSHAFLQHIAETVDWGGRPAVGGTKWMPSYGVGSVTGTDPYKAAGTAADFLYATHAVNYSFIFETP